MGVQYKVGRFCKFFFSSGFGSVIQTQSVCQIVSIFPKWGLNIPKLLQTVKVKTLSTKIECAMYKNSERHFQRKGSSYKKSE